MNQHGTGMLGFVVMSFDPISQVWALSCGSSQAFCQKLDRSFPKLRDHFGSPYNKDYSIFESILGSPYKKGTIRCTWQGERSQYGKQGEDIESASKMR